MSTERRKPVQRRSRERVELILAEARVLISESGAGQFTMRALADRSGLSVPSLYRYFRDNNAILTALLDREQEKIDLQAAKAFAGLERVTLRDLIEQITLAYFRYFEDNREIALLWYGGSPEIAARVRQRDAAAAAWIWDAVTAAHMIRKDTPSFLILGIVRMTDRALEHAFTDLTDEADRRRGINEYIEMISARVDLYATKAGRDGLPLEKFIAVIPPPPAYSEL